MLGSQSSVNNPVEAIDGILQHDAAINTNFSMIVADNHHFLAGEKHFQGHQSIQCPIPNLDKFDI